MGRLTHRGSPGRAPGPRQRWAWYVAGSRTLHQSQCCSIRVKATWQRRASPLTRLLILTNSSLLKPQGSSRARLHSGRVLGGGRRLGEDQLKWSVLGTLRSDSQKNRRSRQSATSQKAGKQSSEQGGASRVSGDSEEWTVQAWVSYCVDRK